MRISFYLSLPIFFITFYLYSIKIRYTFAWNYTILGFSDNVLIWRFAIWRNKAYLAIPRWDKNSKIPFTLLEAPWPEFKNPLQQFGAAATDVIPFLNDKYHQEGNCENLQSVTGLDSDSRGRLWILDAPTRSDSCTAKIIVFDLRRNEKIAETELQGVYSQNLKCLVTDPVVNQWGGGQAYVSDPGDESLIVYNLFRKSWWKLKLSSEFHIPKIFSTDLAISRKNSLMYLTGYQSDDLFAIDLESVRSEWGTQLLALKNESLNQTSVSWIGSKMGSSSGLICDLKEGLHYFIITEIASVRWDSKHKLKAEDHAVLLQSELVPSVTDYALDSQKNVWALINDRHPLRKTTKSSNRLKNMKSLKRRTIKVYKYNPFIF